MISERDIYASATNLIIQHGEDAGFVAAQRADELNDLGDREGFLTFIRIAEAIKVLNNQEPPSDLLN